jgi:hypothetical protein
MNNQKTLIVGLLVIGGVYAVYKLNGETLPSIPFASLSPLNTPPQYPSPTETTKYASVPASQDPVAPDSRKLGACSISTISEYNAYVGSYDRVSEDIAIEDFNTILTGIKADSGCFSPPN